MEYGKVAYWVLQVAEVCLWYCLLFPEMTDRRTKRGERGRLWAAVLVWGGLYGYNGTIAPVSFNLARASSLIAGVLFFIFSRKHVLFGSLWAFLSCSTAHLIKLAALLGRGIALRKGVIEMNYESSIRLDCIVEILLITVLYLGFRAVRKKKFLLVQIFEKIWPFLLVVGILECILLRYIMHTGAYEISASMMVLNLCVIVMTIGCLVSAIFWYINRQNQEEQRRTRIRVKQLREQYEAIREEYLRVSGMIHEKNRERQYLRFCLAEGKMEKALRYLDEKEKTERKSNRVWTKSPLLDFLINMRKEKMDQNGIEFSLQTDFSVLPVKEEDFYILLGNLLDNAMEAAGKCEPERRRILLKLYCVNEMFCICLENTSIEYPQVENGKFRSTKEEKGHGFGIENIRSIVENYGGTIRFGYTDRDFHVEVWFSRAGENEG